MAFCVMKLQHDDGEGTEEAVADGIVNGRGEDGTGIVAF